MQDQNKYTQEINNSEESNREISKKRSFGKNVLIAIASVGIGIGFAASVVYGINKTNESHKDYQNQQNQPESISDIILPTATTENQKTLSKVEFNDLYDKYVNHEN